ncbi:MAG: MgtC/SapB family protein [Gemmatimonadota bacterium]
MSAGAAQGLDAMFGGGSPQDFPTIEQGLSAFRDAGQIAYLALGIALAILLSSVIAFHPRRRGRVRDDADLEYPRTIILFAVVGAIVAQIVRVSPAMALVVFGIGGLIRFRTRIGAPADTGHAILATLIGIAAGMGMFLLAVIGTITAWLLILTMESRPAYRLRVRDLDELGALEAREKIRPILAASGWKVLGEAHRPDEGKLDFYVRGKDPDAAESLRAELRQAFEEAEGRVRLEDAI